MTFPCRLARTPLQRSLLLGLAAFLALAALAGAQALSSRPRSGPHVLPARGIQRDRGSLNLKSGTNLFYHGGPVIPSAHVVFIFWGPSFSNAASPDYSYAQTLQSFRNQFGTTFEYNTITQYSGFNGFVTLTNLAAGPPDWFDSSTPPANVTDALAQGEVNTYLATHYFDSSAIYEVVLPSASYSSYSSPSGTLTSCGGPSLGYCAYHYYYTSGTNVVIYSVQPYASCSACHSGGWTAAQNQEHFVTHETREAVTDPQINAWLDANEQEADDKCVWSPSPFFGTGGYGYQYEWSNALNGCTASTPYSSPPNYAGSLEHAGCDTITGWAADDDRLNTSITVSIYDNQTLVTTVLASNYRPDVATYLGDNGLHGFSIATPSSFQNGLTHQVNVRFETSGVDLTASPASLTCATPVPVADFTFTCTGLSCSFNGAGSTGTGLTYAWTFGDSGTGTGSSTSHSYPNVSGTNVYTATLTVTDSLGRQSAKGKKVSVSGDPVAAAENYFAVAPCRLLDTRNTTILTSDQPRLITVAGSCGIPSTAKAVSLNATAVSPTGSGKITLYPGNLTTAWPGAKSSLNFDPASSPRSNSAVIQLATDNTGTLGINASVSGSPGQVHLILDVQGYFSADTTPAAGAQGPLGFQTVSPCRLADTRSSSPLVAGAPRAFTAQGVCGVPAGAAVASLHVGVPGSAYSGSIALYPSDIAAPGTTTINFQSGISGLRNDARVSLSPTAPDFTALFSATAGASVDAYFDVNGYFKSDAPLKYHPITPCRPVDSAVLTTDTVSTFQFQGNCGVPVGAKAALLRLVVAAPTSSGDLTVYPSNLSLPAISTVKFDANEPGLSMGTIVPLSTLANDLAASPGQMTAGGTVVVSIDVFGYFQ